MADVSGAREIPGLRVEPARAVPAAALRYFTRTGEFAAALGAHGLTLPECGHALRGEELTLAWRSPTETLCLAATSERLTQLHAHLGERADGCLLELTGALDLVALSGCARGGAAHAPRQYRLAAGRRRRRAAAAWPTCPCWRSPSTLRACSSCSSAPIANICSGGSMRRSPILREAVTAAAERPLRFLGIDG